VAVHILHVIRSMHRLSHLLAQRAAACQGPKVRSVTQLDVAHVLCRTTQGASSGDLEKPSEQLDLRLSERNT
jgi:hypothetical protein